MSSMDTIVVGSPLPPPILFIYGANGAGKTTLAASFPKPIFVSTENGLNTVNPENGEVLSSYTPSFPVSKNYADLRNALYGLCSEEHDFQTVVVDSVDHIEPLIYADILQSRPTNEKGHKVENIEDYGYGKGYTYALDYWQDFLELIQYLRDHKGMTVILLAHSEIKRFDDPSGDGYDRFDVAMRPKSAQRILDISDCIFLIKPKTIVTGEKVGFGGEKKKASGNGDRILYTDSRGYFVAKNRYGMPPDIPVRANDLFGSIARYIPYFNSTNGVK